jgi:hypothetical protein
MAPAGDILKSVTERNVPLVREIPRIDDDADTIDSKSSMAN